MRRELCALIAGVFLASAGRDSSTEVGWDYHEKGEPRARIEMRRDAEGRWVREGAFQSWYANGELQMEGQMAANEEAGPWTKYFENGRVRKLVNYRAGKLHGDYASFYENGQQASTGQFEDGVPAGEWTVWKEDGSLDPERSGSYVDGELAGD